MSIYLAVSIGEAYDKLTILLIKEMKIEDEEKLKNIKKELEGIKDAVRRNRIDDEDFNDLLMINMKIWNQEERKRELEIDNSWKDEFVDIARANFQDNDVRANIKMRINKKYGSYIAEEKSYDKFK